MSITKGFNSTKTFSRLLTTMMAFLSLIAMFGCQGQDKMSISSAKPTSTGVTEALSMKEQVAQAKYVFDTRSTSEFNSGHLAHAVHVEYTEIAERIAEFVQDKNSVIYVYCASGGRSGRAQNSLIEKGYVNVINAGGYSSLK